MDSPEPAAHSVDSVGLDPRISPSPPPIERVPADEITVGRIHEGAGRRYWAPDSGGAAVNLNDIRTLHNNDHHDSAQAEDDAIDATLRAFGIDAVPYQRRIIRHIFW